VLQGRFIENDPLKFQFTSRLSTVGFSPVLLKVFFFDPANHELLCTTQIYYACLKLLKYVQMYTKSKS